jgi:hypothetical protein
MSREPFAWTDRWPLPTWYPPAEALTSLMEEARRRARLGRLRRRIRPLAGALLLLILGLGIAWWARPGPEQAPTPDDFSTLEWEFPRQQLQPRLEEIQNHIVWIRQSLDYELRFAQQEE